MTGNLLKTVSKEEIARARQQPVDRETLAVAQTIVDDVRTNGEKSLRHYAEKFGDIEPGAPLFIGKEQIEKAKSQIAASDLALLDRTAARIAAFAKAQRECLKNLDTPIEGGRAGHTVTPVERAGCYAPGGRFPLPSSVLMTAVTARAAGVKEVFLASPRPAPITLAAAAVAGVEGLLAAGGAGAIAAMAYGIGEVLPCDVIVGPGNRFVTAAKQIIYGKAAIDMLAGPSELLVLADDTADPALVAADLLAQAEHDPDAVPALVVATESSFIEKVTGELKRQLESLPTREVALQALQNGFAVQSKNMAEAIEICDLFAPEHLALHVAGPGEVAKKCNHYGGLFVGAAAGEVLGDYGAGPNHTLPTGGTARYTGGLSVLNFLRVRTWIEMNDTDGEGRDASTLLLEDAARLAELEGLWGHAQSAKKRYPGP